MNKDCSLIFDINNNELSITIGDETLIIDEFLTDVNNLRVTVLNIDEQKKIIKKLVNNI